MSKIHKEIAGLMTSSAADDNLSDLEFIKVLKSKTKEVVKGLQTVATDGPEGKPVVMQETIDGLTMKSSMKNFLWNLALAEGVAG